MPSSLTVSSPVSAPSGGRSHAAAAAVPTLAGNAALGLTQIILWGGSFFLVAVLAGPVVESTGWPRGLVVGALSLAILVSGLPSPWVGRMIRRHGGRPVLVAGAFLIAAGQVLMALSSSLPMFLAAWAVTGLGMSAGLYDPLFAAIGQAYGAAARGAITQVSVASGFAITLCWPTTSALIAEVGWRGACLVYAALAVLVVAPIFAWVIPRRERPAEAAAEPSATSPPEPDAEMRRLPGERLLALTFTSAAILMTAISVQLLEMLQARGVAAGTAVALGALIGPSQVGARIVELLLARTAHPVWGQLVSSVSVGLGLLLLAVDPSLAWLAIVLYGAGNGVRTVVRGTLPLALYGRDEYPAAMGRLARLPLLGQAATPLACGYVLEWFGSGATLLSLLAVAALSTGLSLAVFRRVSRSVPADPA